MSGSDHGKILFITHQLSLSGAPLVLMDMIRACQEEGFAVDLISLTDGPLSATLDEMGVPWQIRNDFLQNAVTFLKEVQPYAAVVINTLVSYPPIFILKHTQIPTIWWLHETEWYFETYDRMPDIAPKLTELPDSIHLLSVSPQVQEILQRRYGRESAVFPFCVKDWGAGSLTRDSSVPSPAGLNQPPSPGGSSKKVRFLTLATYSTVKGQDVLAEAIRLLPKEILRHCEFLLYGGDLQQEPDFRKVIGEQLTGIPEAVVHSAIPHEEAMKILNNCDYGLIPSREEPFSAVAVEAMTLKKPCILTSICGVTAYLKDGEDALFCPPEDAQALSDRIREAAEFKLSRPEEYARMGEYARSVYDTEFSPQRFRARLGALFQEVGVLR